MDGLEHTELLTLPATAHTTSLHSITLTRLCSNPVTASQQRSHSSSLCAALLCSAVHHATRSM
eukprot:4842813-Amphidinium_carterae.2